MREDGKIDEGRLAFMRDFVEVKRPFRPWNSVATSDAIWHFTFGLGDDNLLWSGVDYAESTTAERDLGLPHHWSAFRSGQKLADA